LSDLRLSQFHKIDKNQRKSIRDENNLMKLQRDESEAA
jgi:hypothetical protein